MLPTVNAVIKTRSVLRFSREVQRSKDPADPEDESVYERNSNAVDESTLLQTRSNPKIGFYAQESTGPGDREDQLEKAKKFFRAKAMVGPAVEGKIVRRSPKTAPQVISTTNAVTSIGSANVRAIETEESVTLRDSHARVSDQRQSFHPEAQTEPQKEIRPQSFEIFSRKEHHAVVNKCVFSQDCSLLVTASSDNSCRIFRRNSERDPSGYDCWVQDAVLKGHKCGIWGVTISSTNDYLFTSGGDETLRLWVIATKVPPEIDIVEIRKMLGKRGENTKGSKKEIFERLKAIMSVDECDAKRAGFLDQYLKTYIEWRCSAVISQRTSESGSQISSNNPIFDCVLHPSNILLATGWCDGSAKIYAGTRQENVTCENGFTHRGWTWDCIQTLTDHEASVFRCAFSPTGDILTTVSKDQSAILYTCCFENTTAFQKIKCLRGHMGPVLGMDYHPSGRLITTSSCDQNSVVWFLPEAEERKHEWTPIATLLGHKKYVKACSFREDGLLLATASRDRTVRLWKMIRKPRDISQLRKFPCIEVLRCHDEVCTVQFGNSTSMALLVAGTLGGQILMWDTSTLITCANPLRLETSSAIRSKLSSRTKHPNQSDIIFQDEGRRVPPRPLTAMSDWSRMQTPNHVAPLSKPTPEASCFAPKIYDDSGEDDLVMQRFSTMEPHCEHELPRCTKRIKDYTAETEYARTRLAMTTSRIMREDIEKVLKIAHALLQENSMDGLVKFKPDAAIVILKTCQFTDSNSIISVIRQVTCNLSDLIQKGLLHRKYPLLRSHEGAPLSLGRRELEYLIESKPSGSTLKNKKQAIKQTADVKLEQQVPLQKAEEFAGNDRGDQLASELIGKTLLEIKRIIGERIVKLITPELSWTRNATRLAGQVTVRMLEGLDSVSDRPQQLRLMCGLVFNFKILYEKALEILKLMQIEPANPTSSNFMHQRSSESRTSIVDVHNLDMWFGAVESLPTPSCRLSCPLYSSSTPTTIGLIFDPDCNGKILQASLSLALATTKTTREARDFDRSDSAGVSFKFMIAEWDLNAETAGAVLLLGHENFITEHCFKNFVLDCGDGQSTSFARNTCLFIGVTTDACFSYSKGAAWISGIGKPSERDRRRGVTYPKSPEAFRHGTRMFAGSPGANSKNRWIVHDETIVCQIKYQEC